MSLTLAGLLSACNTAPTYLIRGVYMTDWKQEIYVYRPNANATDAARFPCGAECSPAWTPLFAGAFDWAAEGFSIVPREDGSWQWAYRGEPLYFYAGRSRALAVDPQMVAGLWAPLKYLPRPSGI